MSSLATLAKACSVRWQGVGVHLNPPSTLWRGSAWMLLAMSCIAIVDGIAKYLAIDLNGVQVAWGYFVAMFINLMGFVLLRRIRLKGLVQTRQWRLQLFRAASLVCSLSCLFFSLRYLPLAEATAISFTSPLFVVAMAGPLLKELVGWGKWCAVLMGLCGALLIVRPGSDILGWAACLPLIGAVFFASFTIMTRMLGPGEKILTTLFYTTMAGSALITLMVPLVWQPLNVLQIATLMVTGVLGLIAHLSMVRAMQIADASTLAPINYTRLLWALGVGWWIFSQVPDSLSLLGSAIIVGSGVFILSVPRRLPINRSPSSQPLNS